MSARGGEEGERAVALEAGGGEFIGEDVVGTQDFFYGEDLALRQPDGEGVVDFEKVAQGVGNEECGCVSLVDECGKGEFVCGREGEAAVVMECLVGLVEPRSEGAGLADDLEDVRGG